MKELELFLKALEKANGRMYIKHLKIEPMLKPAFKDVTLTIHSMLEGVIVPETVVEKVFKITNDEEKQSALLEVTETAMVNILKEYEKYIEKV